MRSVVFRVSTTEKISGSSVLFSIQENALKIDSLTGVKIVPQTKADQFFFFLFSATEHVLPLHSTPAPDCVAIT